MKRLACDRSVIPNNRVNSFIIHCDYIFNSEPNSPASNLHKISSLIGNSIMVTVRQAILVAQI